MQHPIWKCTPAIDSHKGFMVGGKYLDLMLEKQKRMLVTYHLSSYNYVGSLVLFYLLMLFSELIYTPIFYLASGHYTVTNHHNFIDLQY